MKQNIKLFPNVDYQDECNSIVDRAKKLLMEKKDKAYIAKGVWCAQPIERR